MRSGSCKVVMCDYGPVTLPTGKFPGTQVKSESLDVKKIGPTLPDVEVTPAIKNALHLS
jgi:hypothetical protein